jgi:hypothetical protein
MPCSPERVTPASLPAIDRLVHSGFQMRLRVSNLKMRVLPVSPTMRITSCTLRGQDVEAPWRCCSLWRERRRVSEPSLTGSIPGGALDGSSPGSAGKTPRSDAGELVDEPLFVRDQAIDPVRDIRGADTVRIAVDVDAIAIRETVLNESQRHIGRTCECLYSHALQSRRQISSGTDRSKVIERALNGWQRERRKCGNQACDEHDSR